MIEPFIPNPARKARARGMGELLKLSENVKDDVKLGCLAREIAERVRKEEVAWKAGLAHEPT